MDTAIGVRVERDNQPCVGGRPPGQKLQFANHVAVVIHVIGHGAAIAPPGDLYNAKGQIRLMEGLAPGLDHCGEGLGKRLPGFAKGVVLPLVEQDPAQGQSPERRNHAVEHAAGLPLMRRVGVGIAIGPTRHTFALGLGLLPPLFPGLEIYLVTLLGPCLTPPGNPGLLLLLELVKVTRHGIKRF